MLVAGVEHNHLYGVEGDGGPDEEHVVGLAVRFVMESLDTDESRRNIPVERLQRDRVMASAPPKCLDLSNENIAVLDSPVPTPSRGARQHRGHERDKEQRNNGKVDGQAMAYGTPSVNICPRPPAQKLQEGSGSDAKYHTHGQLVHGDSRNRNH